MKVNGIRFKILIIVLIGAIAFSFVQTRNLFEITKNLEIFTSVYKEIDLNYVEELNPGEMMKTGIDAMLGSLDPYTNFYTESQAEDALIKRKGDYGTPGIDVELMQNNLVITSIASGSSAEFVGMQLGDIILEVNEKSFKDKPVSEVYESFEGSVGSFVKLKYLREGTEREITMERRKPDFSNMSYYGTLQSGKVGYIKLDQFMENSANEVRDAFIDLKKQNISSLILDLRNNGGGLLVDAVRIVNLFVERNLVIVFNKGKSPENYHEFRTMEEPIDTKMPLVVLINKNSASASEIVSGAIQDLDRGIVVGRNSFGKGLVQNVLPLPYRHQIKVTVAKYYIPSGRCIQAIDYSKKKPEDNTVIAEFKTKNNRKVFEGAGIKPDIMVEDVPDNEFFKALKSQSILFEFVASKEIPDEIPVAEDFRLSQYWFNQLKDFEKTKNFSYQTVTEQNLKALMASAESESYTATTQTLSKDLQSAISKAKEQDWERYKEYLEVMIAIETARKMYGEKGKFPVLFRYDKDIHKAVEVLNDNTVYRQTLLP